MSILPDPGRTGARQRYKTWIKHQSECVWCGEDFWFYSPVDEDGKPKRAIRYCSKKCIAEAQWEGRKKVPAVSVLREMYVIKAMSIPQIAAVYQCSTAVVGKALRESGTPMREHTSRRRCKVCGVLVQKKFHSRRDSSGCRILWGTLCETHRKALAAERARRYGRARDPLRGTRKTGKKAEACPCPKCGRVCDGTRKARACCNQSWSKIKAAKSAFTVQRDGAASPGPAVPEPAPLT